MLLRQTKVPSLKVLYPQLPGVKPSGTDKMFPALAINSDVVARFYLSPVERLGHAACVMTDVLVAGNALVVRSFSSTPAREAVAAARGQKVTSPPANTQPYSCASS